MPRQLTIQALKAATAARTADTPANGELVVDITLMAANQPFLFVGDGATAGGKNVTVGAAAPITTVHGRTGAVVADNGDYNATQVTFTPAGNTISVTVAAAIAELQTEIDGLQTINATDFIAGGANPVGGDGTDGQYFMNVLTGDVFGPKAGGAWPAASGNAYSNLGLSAVAASAPVAVATVGVATTAARADHAHAFQSAVQTPVTAIAGLTATDVQAGLAELQGDITGLTTAQVVVGATVGAALGTAAAGASAQAARADHVHPMPTWTGLTDTQATITALNIVRGNAGGTALEMVSVLDAGTL